MRSTGSRWLALAAALVLGLLLYYFYRPPQHGGGDGGQPTPPPTAVVVITVTPTPAPPTPTCVPLLATPGVQRVLVGPGACDVKPECVTIQAGRDTIQWNTTGVPQGQNLAIDFDVKIFGGMTSSNGGKSYRVQCSGQQCLSGAVSTSVTPPPGRQQEYKYSQTIYDSGNSQACDGRIIIRW
jgi:hypothetical protein